VRAEGRDRNGERGTWREKGTERMKGKESEREMGRTGDGLMDIPAEVSTCT